MPLDQLPLEQKIQQDRLDHIYQRSKAAILALFAAGSLYTFLLYRVTPKPSILLWYAVFLTVLLARLFHVYSYHRSTTVADNQKFWLNTYRIAILMTGSLVGSLNLFFFPKNSLPDLLLAIIFPFGIVVGAVSILVDFVAFSIYAATLMLPIASTLIRIDPSLLT